MTLKSEIEIQAVNLAQQWYSLPHERLPELPELLNRYLHCFSDNTDQQQFLKETLRITEELSHGPKAETVSPHAILVFKELLLHHLK
ncbi:hypothetical protein [Taibaiella koreensis]|uniref:hypothetical protein n=1 Tax=Taibaiella koreensis TaxID=1268548 RepID=UPI000E59A0D2|nr:hypothetical protein [Taibaiella koreensis]